MAGKLGASDVVVVLDTNVVAVEPVANVVVVVGATVVVVVAPTPLVGPMTFTGVRQETVVSSPN